jgi:hypothetical protein
MILLAALALLAAPTPYKVDPTSGNSNFSAIFELPLGERINAISPRVGCDLKVDDEKGTVSGFCSVPLVSITVDNEPVKAEHFQQWATNKKSKPKACLFEAKFENVPAKLEAGKEVPFTTNVAFTVCGKARTGGGMELLEGVATLMAAGTYNDVPTIRIRAHISKFDREAYQIGPKFTDGWLARVQGLAQVVAPVGSIELSLFARLDDGKVVAKKK